MSTLLRAAIVGARHPHLFRRVELLSRHPRVTLLGFHEPDAEIADELSRRTGLPALDAADLAGLDLAVIEGLDPQLPGLADLALRAGARGVLLEKPGADQPAAFYELAARLEAAGTVVELGYQLHYADAAGWCREIVREGILGQLTASRFHGGVPVGAGAELWQSIPEDLGGLVYTSGCHLLEWVYDLFGLPEQVSASIRRLPAGEPVPALVYKPDLFSGPVDADVRIGDLLHEDVGSALLEYPGQTVTVDFTAWEPTTWCAQWWVELYGTNGSVVAVPHPSELRLTLREPRGRFPAGETVLRSDGLPEGAGMADAYTRQLESLIARLLGDQPATPSPDSCGLDHGVGVMRLLEAIYDSSRRRAWTAVAPSTERRQG